MIAHSIPDSSSVSRTAAWATDSPRSTAPPGMAQLSLSGAADHQESRLRRMTTITLTDGTRLLALGASGSA